MRENFMWAKIIIIIEQIEFTGTKAKILLHEYAS